MASKSPSKRSRREQAQAASRRRTTTLFALGAAAVAIAAVIILVSSNSGPKKQPGEKLYGQNDIAQEFAGIPQEGTFLGQKDAPYTLVEYADLQCTACKTYSEQVMPVVISELVRSGKVRLQLKPISIFPPDSDKAAIWSYGAGAQNKLFEFTGLWYRNQGAEKTGYVTEDFARNIASGVAGLNAQQMLDDAQAAKEFEANNKEFYAQRFNQTPTFTFAKTGEPQVQVPYGTDLLPYLRGQMR